MSAKSKKGLREYQGKPYSDLKGFIPNKDAIGNLVRDEHPADFYSAIDKTTRHKIGSVTYRTPDKRFYLKINEMRSSRDVPEFNINTWEVKSEEEKRNAFNLGASSSVTDMLFAEGFEELNEKIKYAVGEIKKFDKIISNSKIHAKSKELTDEQEEVYNWDFLKEKSDKELEKSLWLANEQLSILGKKYGMLLSDYEKYPENIKRASNHLSERRRRVEEELDGRRLKKVTTNTPVHTVTKIEKDTNYKYSGLSLMGNQMHLSRQQEVAKRLDYKLSDLHFWHLGKNEWGVFVKKDAAKGHKTEALLPGGKNENNNKGRSEKAITQDKKIGALAPGKRISESGTVYYESRPNRSDENPRNKFDQGGEVSVEKITAIHNKAYQNFKEKFGERWANKYFANVDRLFPPFSTNIVEYRGNGVVVKENNKYILKPLGDMDLKVWQVIVFSPPLDVSDQFVGK